MLAPHRCLMRERGRIRSLLVCRREQPRRTRALPASPPLPARHRWHLRPCVPQLRALLSVFRRPSGSAIGRPPHTSTRLPLASPPPDDHCRPRNVQKHIEHFRITNTGPFQAKARSRAPAVATGAPHPARRVRARSPDIVSLRCPNRGSFWTCGGDRQRATLRAGTCRAAGPTKCRGQSPTQRLDVHAHESIVSAHVHMHTQSPPRWVNQKKQPGSGRSDPEA